MSFGSTATATTPTSVVWSTTVSPNLQAASGEAACQESWHQWELINGWAATYGYGNSGWNAPNYSGNQTSGSCVSYYWYPQGMPPGPPVTGDTRAFYKAYAKVTCPAGSEARGGDCYTTNSEYPPENNSMPDTCAGTNPCNAGTGNKYQRELDYVGSGSYPLQLERAYNSNAMVKGSFSDYWTGFYDRYIEANTNGTISTAMVMRHGGNAHYFKLINGAWKGDAQVNGTLIQQTDAAQNVTGWTYINELDEIETYDASGKLLYISNTQGLSQVLTYSCKILSASCPVITPPTVARIEGLLISVVDASGRKLNFTYDGSSRVNTMTDPSDAVYVYTYSGPAPGGNLLSVTYPDGKKKTYLYGEAGNVSPTPNIGVSYTHALTGIIDENGARYASWTYDAAGRATSSEHGSFGSGIDHIGLAYTAPDANGDSLTSVTDTLGVNRTYAFSTLQGVVKNTGIIGQPCNGCSAAFTYDTNGNITSKIDFNGNQTTYSYDLIRNLEISRTEGLTAAGANTPQTRTITTEWHPTFRLPTKITEPGLETAYTYDTKGHITLKSLKDLVTNKTRTWTTAYTYSTTGLLVQKVEDGPRTDVPDLITTDYYPEDAACIGGHFGCRGQLKQITSALGHVTSFTRYSAHGYPEVITDPNGLTQIMVYDVRQRLISMDVGGELTTYSYDPVGQLTRVTQPNGAYLAYTYDNAHRLLGVKDQLGNSRSYTLDNRGKRTKDEVFDPNGQLVRSQSRVYDSLSRLQNLILSQ
jgi:YD repeat-containing protein